MSEQHSGATLNLTVTLLAARRGAERAHGSLPGSVLLLAAGVVAVAQRSTLARAIRTPDSNRRRRRLTTAAVLAVVFVASFVSFMRDTE